MLEVGRRADHASVYSPTSALRLRRRLVAAREPLQPNFTARTCHFTYFSNVHCTRNFTHSTTYNRGLFELRIYMRVLSSVLYSECCVRNSNQNSECYVRNSNLNFELFSKCKEAQGCERAPDRMLSMVDRAMH